MKIADLRARFLQVLERFNSGEFDIQAFWEEVEVLNRAGLHREIKKGQEEHAVSRLTWSIDMYDPQLQPRQGLRARLMDMCGAVFRDEYRISHEEVRTRAIAVEQIMKQAKD